MENVSISTREDVLNAAVARIGSNPNARFVILVDGDERGLETFSTSGSFIWILGLLRVATLINEENLRRVMAAGNSVAEAEARFSVDNAIKSGRGPAN